MNHLARLIQLISQNFVEYHIHAIFFAKFMTYVAKLEKETKNFREKIIIKEGMMIMITHMLPESIQ